MPERLGDHPDIRPDVDAVLAVGVSEFVRSDRSLLAALAHEAQEPRVGHEVRPPEVRDLLGSEPTVEADDEDDPVPQARLGRERALHDLEGREHGEHALQAGRLELGAGVDLQKPVSVRPSGEAFDRHGVGTEGPLLLALVAESTLPLD